MKRAGTLLIAAVLLLTLCACKRETRPAVGLGTFHGEQVSVYGGDWQPIGEVYSGQTYLTLNAGGEGVFCVDGEAAAVEWETSGGRLTLTMGSARCEGTIDANTVTIGFFDADIRMSFSRTASAALPLLDSLPEQAQEPPVQVKDPKLMFKLIRASFNQRRKTLQNGLNNAPELPFSKEKVAAAIARMGLPASVRGEALTLSQFAELSDILGEP